MILTTGDQYISATYNKFFLETQSQQQDGLREVSHNNATWKLYFIRFLRFMYMHLCISVYHVYMGEQKPEGLDPMKPCICYFCFCISVYIHLSSYILHKKY